MPDIDIERMAKEQDISVALIKASLGLPPSDVSEASSMYQHIRYTDDRLAKKALLEAWGNLCTHSKDMEEFLSEARHFGEDKTLDSLKKKLEGKWAELVHADIVGATSFAEVNQAFSSAPNECSKELRGLAAHKMIEMASNFNEALRALKVSQQTDFRKLAAEKIVPYCSTSAHMSEAYDVARSDISDQDAFCKKWADLCGDNAKEIKKAFELTSHSIFVGKMLEMCTTAREVRILYKKHERDQKWRSKIFARWLELCKTPEELREILDKVKGVDTKAIVRRIADFYRK